MGINIFKSDSNPLIKKAASFSLSVASMSRFEQIPGDIAYFREISLADFENFLSLSIIITSDGVSTGGAVTFGVSVYHKIEGSYTLAGSALGGSVASNTKTFYAGFFSSITNGRQLLIPSTTYTVPTTNQQLFQDSNAAYRDTAFTNLYVPTASGQVINAPIKADSILLATIQGNGVGGSPAQTFNLQVIGVY